MKRRDFLKSAGVAAAVTAATACGVNAEDAGAKDKAAASAGSLELTGKLKEQLTKNCWTYMPFFDEDGPDKECLAVNVMLDGTTHLPEWAVNVRKSMPAYEFERCSHRWLDGVDEVMQMIADEKHFSSRAGRCGDVPGKVSAAAERRALAVQRWIDRTSNERDELDVRVAGWLGERNPDKLKAAACFVDLVRAFFFGPEDAAKAKAKEWRESVKGNVVLRMLFKDEGIDNLLSNKCGFMVINRLDLNIRIIGGDLSHAADRSGVCNDQLRFDYTHDPGRIEVACGYQWGLYAYLMKYDADWLRKNKPDCAGAAIYAL